MITEFLRRVFGLNHNHEKVATDLKTRVLSGREEDIKELQKINKTVKLLLASGSIEVTLHNVDGVIHEVKKGRKKQK